MTKHSARANVLTDYAIGACWSRDSEDRREVSVGLGPKIQRGLGPHPREAAYFLGLITEKPEGGTAMHFLDLGVYDHKDFRLRRGGTATRLVSALAHVAILEGANTFSGIVDSQHTLRIFRTLFGEDRISYNEPTLATTSEAIEFLAQAEAIDEDLENPMVAIDVAVDLTGVNPDSLEKPIILS